MPFAQALQATDGAPPYQWTIVSGALPSGLSLRPDGAIVGTPLTTPGTYVVMVRVSDISGGYVDAPVTIVVSGTPVQIGATSISVVLNKPFSYLLSASGGVGPYTWEPVGTLPPGLTLTTGGLLSGTLTPVGTYNVPVRVTDKIGATAQANITIKVVDPTATP